MQEMQVQSQGQEDPLEEEMATHSSILAWEIPRTEEPGGLQYIGSQRVRHDLVTKQQQQQHLLLKCCSAHTHTHTDFIVLSKQEENSRLYLFMIRIYLKSKLNIRNIM